MTGTQTYAPPNMEIEHATPAEILASIDQLLTKILLLLPIKSLIRFKLVSKRWLSLISDPTFCRLRNPSPNPAIGLFFPSHDAHHWLSLPFYADRSITPPFRSPEFAKNSTDVRIHQSCNGLLLCSSISWFDRITRYYVYNPTINCFSELPKPDERIGLSDGICGVSLVFDPVRSRHYNVVWVWSVKVNYGGNEYQIGMYSSQTVSWQLCGGQFAASVDFDNGVYWNGALHWLCSRRGHSLYFKVDTQVLDKMPGQPVRYSWIHRTGYYYGESCGHLHFTEIVGPLIGFDVYEMRRDYSGWFIVYKVNLSSVVDSHPEMNLQFRLSFPVVAIIRGGEREEDSFLVLHFPGKAIRYNLVSKTFENLPEFDDDTPEQCLRYSGKRKGFQYIESLYCV